VLKVRWLFALLLLVGFAGQAFVQDKDDKKEDPKKEDKKDDGKAELKWKFEEGKTFYQEMSTETKQSMQVMGANITQKQSQTFWFSWKPEKFDTEKKTWTVKQKIEGVKIEIDIGGQKVSYNSTADSATNSALAEFFKALVGSEFTLTLDSNFKVTKVEGRDEFVKKLATANQQMEPLLKQILSDDALKQMADPAFSIAPKDPVKKGDSWDKNVQLNMGPIGTYKTKYKYTYDGIDEKEKKDRIKVETTLEYTPPTESSTSIPFKIKGAKLTSKDSTGSVLFDREKGRVDQSEMELKLDGTLSIEIGGNTTEVTLSQEQKTTIKTTDDNPVQKK
jgi:phage tail tube protein FII